MSKTDLIQGLESLRVALDPELREARAEWLETEAGRRMSLRKDSHASGWQRGTPQCPSCRRILNGHGQWCPDCRTFDGRQSHG